MFSYGESRWLICTRCRSFSHFLLQMFFSQFCYTLFLFINNEDQASKLLIFVSFCSSCLMVALVVWPMSARNAVISGFKIDIYNQWLWNFRKNVFETAEFWFENYFMFIAKEKLLFSLICSFYCCLVKGVEPWKLLSNLPREG